VSSANEEGTVSKASFHDASFNSWLRQRQIAVDSGTIDNPACKIDYVAVGGKSPAHEMD
jgi:hypothetical protein